MEGNSARQSDDDDDHANKSSLISIVTTLSKLKRKVLSNRGVDVTAKMRNNYAKLRQYTSCLSNSVTRGGDKSCPGDDKLTFRSQKVLCSFSNPDAGSEIKDEGPTVGAPIIFGSSSGGKTAVRPCKLQSQQNVPPYTTWIYLDRNQRMTEDQSVQGRRRIYYDPIGNETLIASDSEEEEADDEEQKHDFSKGEDYIIWTAVRERGVSALLFEQIAQCIHVNCDEVQARYDLLLNDADKQAKCAAHSENIRLNVPSPVGRRKGKRDVGRTVYKDTQSDSKEYFKSDGNTMTLKLEDNKVEAKDLVAAMDSFDNLFCRRCLVFDCRLHGCSQPLVHPSERQPSINTDSEATSPCGPYCYLLSHCAYGEAESCIHSILDVKTGDNRSSSGEGEDRARSPKREKEGETSWGDEKHGFADPIFDQTAKFFPGASQVYSPFSKVGNKNKDITAGRTTETPVLLSPNHTCFSLKREQPSVASRLTSHKKLARSTTRRTSEDIGAVVNELQHRPKQVTVVDLTGMDGELLSEYGNGNGPGNEFVGEMIGKTMDVNTRSDQQHSKHVRREFHREELNLQQEKTRFSLTKKLARKMKRALEENVQSSLVTKQSQVQGDQMNLGKSALALQDVPIVKRLARTIENGTQERFTGAASTTPQLAEGVKMDICWMGADLMKEKSKVTSPKKLARRARKPIVTEPVGIDEGQELQSKLPIPEEGLVKEEKTRNTAARKLARSARKVFAEKVAVAIQQQQFQSQLDLISKSHVIAEQSKEDRIDFGDANQVSVIADTATPITRVKSLAWLSTTERSCGVVGSQFTDKNWHILVDNHEEDSTDVIKAACTHSGPAKVGSLMQGPVSNSQEGFKQAEFNDAWTALEKGLYEKGLQMFGKSSCKIAKNMLKGCKTCQDVRDYIVAQDAAAKRGVQAGVHQFPDSVACVLKWDVARARARFYGRKKGSRKLKFTLKSAGQSAIRKRMVNGKDAPCRQYTPCGCLFTCGKQCPCQLSGTCCEKYCGCAKSCKNRFRGCHCAKSQCCSRQCPCFAAGRECDPDVCRNCWIGCGDGKVVGLSQREDKDNYQCHNMKLLLKQQQRVLLSRSDVAGWGAFLKNTVSKHEYLGEYTGELISHREADKRGKIYDRENSSFLFNLNDQYVLDACRKGDKLKFANHSPNPNCYAKVIMVAGDHRVGIFAKERILAGEELFYDYRYEADRAPAWARRGEDCANSKKDDCGPSERRSKHAS